MTFLINPYRYAATAAFTDFIDFGSYSTGAAPGDWSLDWVTTGASLEIVADATSPTGSGKKLRFTTGGSHTSSFYLARWDGSPDTEADYEILTLTKLDSGPVGTTGSRLGHAVAGGISGNVSNKNGHWGGLWPQYAANDKIFTQSFNANAQTGFDESGYNWLDITVRYWTRLRKSGGVVDLSIWKEGESEPGSAQSTIASGATDEVGKIGFVCQKESWVADVFWIGWVNGGGVVPVPSWG